jgi:hypothetical protein
VRYLKIIQEVEWQFPVSEEREDGLLLLNAEFQLYKMKSSEVRG